MNHSDKLILIDQAVRLDMEDMTFWKKCIYDNALFAQQNVNMAKESIKNLIELRKSFTNTSSNDHNNR